MHLFNYAKNFKKNQCYQSCFVIKGRKTSDPYTTENCVKSYNPFGKPFRSRHIWDTKKINPLPWKFHYHQFILRNNSTGITMKLLRYLSRLYLKLQYLLHQVTNFSGIITGTVTLLPQNSTTLEKHFKCSTLLPLNHCSAILYRSWHGGSAFSSYVNKKNRVDTLSIEPSATLKRCLWT